MAAPYDTLEAIVNAARARLNDMIASAGGDILTDTNVFTIFMVNDAWRKLQDFLARLGFSRFTNEVFFLATAGSVKQINWTTTPVLPADFILPMRMWERITGTTNYLEMDKLTRGLPIVATEPWNKRWEWREENIYLPGVSSSTMDYRVRYAAFLPDFVAAGSTAFASQPVPIMRCLNAFSLYIAAEMAAPRGDLDAAEITKMAEENATIMVGRENAAVLTVPEGK